MAYRILGPVGEANIEVDVIRIVVAKMPPISPLPLRAVIWKQPPQRLPVVAELDTGEVLTDDHIAKVSVVGVGMRSHSGVSDYVRHGRCWGQHSDDQYLRDQNSVIIEEKYLELAVRSLHSAFGLDTVEDEEDSASDSKRW